MVVCFRAPPPTPNDNSRQPLLRKLVTTTLWFRRSACRDADYAHPYRALGMAVSGVGNGQIFGPDCHFAKFADLLCPTSMPDSTSTRIRSGRPPRASWSAAMLLGSYRMKALRNSQNQKSLFSHSNISSALTKTAGGTASPSAFAVCRLTIIKYLTGCWTGRSDAFAPRRMRSA